MSDSWRTPVQPNFRMEQDLRDIDMLVSGNQVAGLAWTLLRPRVDFREVRSARLAMECVLEAERHARRVSQDQAELRETNKLVDDMTEALQRLLRAYQKACTLDDVAYMADEADEAEGLVHEWNEKKALIQQQARRAEIEDQQRMAAARIRRQPPSPEELSRIAGNPGPLPPSFNTTGSHDSS